MKAKKLFKFIIVQVIICQYLVAQVAVSSFNTSTGFTTKDGLDSNYIADIKEDADGFLWLATSKGVTKFDGNHFINFKYYYRDSVPLEIGMINSLEINNTTNEIWAGGENGLFKMSTREVHVDKISSPMLPISGNPIRKVFFDDQNLLWLANGNEGLIKINVEKSTKEIFTFKDNYQNESSNVNIVQDLIQDPDSPEILWLGTGAGLIKFNKNSNNYERYVYHNESELPQNRIRKIAIDDHKIFLGTWEAGLIVFNKDTKDFYQPLKEAFPDSQHLIIDIYKYQELLWITTFQGLIQYDLCSDSIKNIIYNNTAKKKIYGNSFIDSRGIIWFGSPRGLFKYDNFHFQFIQLEDKNNFQHPLDVKKILKTNGFWYVIGYAGEGLYKINPIDYTFEIIKIPYLQYIDEIGYEIADMIETDDGKFLILSHRKLVFFDPKTEEFELSPLQISYEAPTIRSITKDKNGRYWVGTRHAGLFGLDFKNRSITNFKEEFNTEQKGNHVWIEDVYADRFDRLWIRTATYMSVMDVNTFKIQNLTNENNGYIYYNVANFQEDDHCRLWVLGYDVGIGYIDTKNPDTKISHQLDGDFKRLYKYTDSLIWVTGKNSMILNTNTTTFRNVILGKSKELTVTGPVVQHKKENLIIGCNNGILIYNEQKRNSSITTPIPYVKKVSVDGETQYEGSSLSKKAFKFGSDTKHITFSISSIGFHLSDQIQYEYKLQDRWIPVGSNNDINFISLPQGAYSLSIKASNDYTQNNEEIAKYDFTILLPWYKTRWAFILMFLGVILVVVLILQWRSSRLKKEKEALEKIVFERTLEIRNKNKQLQFQAEQLQEMNKTKSRFIANISHEFRTPITLIKGPISNFLKTKEKKKLPLDSIKMIDRNIDRLLRLVNQLLDLSKLDSRKIKLQLKEGDIYQFLRVISSSFDSYAVERNIIYTSGVPNNTKIALFDQDKLEKIVYNLLSNAFKYSPHNKEVKFLAFIKNGVLKLEVSDMGKGIPKDQLDKIFERFYQIDSSSTRDQEGSGIGLSLTKELVTLMHGDIQVKSVVDKGTVFIVEIPIKIVEEKYLETNKSVEKMNEQIVHEECHVLQEPENELPIILIVEDNQDMRTFIRKQLQGIYKVLEAVDGLSGINIALKEVPDLIVTDLMMPQVDGISLCKNIRSDKRTSHIPIIMLTAKAQKESKIKGLSEGADDYLLKPFDGEELLVRIKNLIKQRKELQKLYSEQITLEPQHSTIESLDKKFLDEVIESIKTHMSESNYGPQEMQEDLMISKTQLYRKMKALTDQSAGEFLRNYRLKKAAQILSDQGGNITEVSIAVGFNSLSYFTRCFKEFHGKSPSEFLKTIKT